MLAREVREDKEIWEAYSQATVNPIYKRRDYLP